MKIKNKPSDNSENFEILNQETIDTNKKKKIKKVKPPKIKPEPTMEQKIRSIAHQQHTDADWIHLDNAALIFPASENADKSNMFRLSVLMKEEVNPIILQQAVNETVPRFPSMTSAVKHGFFWYYLEPSNKPLIIEEQHDFPSRKIPLDARHPLIRVTYFSHEISVEFFHVATDGTGGITYLNSLVACYLRLCGNAISDNTNCLDTRDKPRPEELIDSFQTNFDKNLKGSAIVKKAYLYHGKRLPVTSLILVKGIMSVTELKKISKQYGVTISELITATLIWAFYQDAIQMGNNYSVKKPIIISVPANLRKLYPSKSLRNFVSLMSIEHNGEDNFDDLLCNVKKQYAQQYNKEFFNQLVCYNLHSQHKLIIKIMPLVIKDIALKIASKKFGDKTRTATFSNLGLISAPEYFKDHVIRYEFSLGPQVQEGIDLTGASFNDTLVLTFSKTIYETNIERLFFTKLSELGLNITIESNFEV